MWELGRSGDVRIVMTEVKYAGATERIADRHYLLVVYDNHGMIVEADSGTTRIVPLDEPESDLGDEEPTLVDNACRTAERLGVPVVYLLDYPEWQSGDPVPLPE
jgi:hypothetical protein